MSQETVVLSDVGSDKPVGVPPAKTTADNPKPTTDKTTSDKARIAGPILVIVACVVIAGGVLLVAAIGWVGLLIVAAGLVGLFWVSYWWWNGRRRGSSKSSRSSSRASRAARASGTPGSRKPGTSRGRGSKNGGAGSGKPKGLAKFFPSLSRKRSGGTGMSQKSRSGKGLGRSRKAGSSRDRFGRFASGGRSNRRSKPPGTPSLNRRGRPKGRHMMHAPSLPSLDATKDAAKKSGRAVLNADRAVGAAVGDAFDAVRPDTKTNKGVTEMSSGGLRSEFEKIAECLPGVAYSDSITTHDLGIEPLIEGLVNGLPLVAQYISNCAQRIEAENHSGTEPITLETFDALSRAVNSCAPVADELLKMLRASPSWQELQARVQDPNGHKSDVGEARRMGLA